MKAVSGVFRSRVDAERAVPVFQSAGVSTEKMTVLTPGDIQRGSTEVGSEALSGPSGMPVFTAVVPGVGMITALGLLGAAVLRAAGAREEAIAGTNIENPASDELPEDEIFVYEEVLRNGGSIFVAMAEEEATGHLRELLNANGTESIDAARHRWWYGLRSSEEKYYSTFDRNFSEDEKFYRLGFEAALHARTRCKEYDQVVGEMNVKLEDVQRKYPGADVEKPFVHGYERGRDYYQGLCNQASAA